MDELHRKEELLKDYLKSMGSVAVAFSAGVDSTYLLQTARDVLGKNAIAVTAKSCFFPEREYTESLNFCKNKGIELLTVESDVLEIDGIRQNPKNRCYLCKKALFEKILNLSKTKGINAVAEGSNMDDCGDYRPGMMAVRELGILSPLKDAGLTKAEIRRLSEEKGLPTWDKPSFACLASRFVYGECISEERLAMVDEAEQLLFDMGLRQLRVRIHGEGTGTIARIEVMPEDFSLLLKDDMRSRIYSRFKEIGFAYVTIDLQGYRTGSMNETIG